MASICLYGNLPAVSLYSTNKTLNPKPRRPLHLSLPSTFLAFDSSLRVPSNYDKLMNMKRRRGFGPVCHSSLLSSHNLHFVSAVSTAILMLARGTAINKSFLVPFFALQAPSSVISWIKGEYGIWSAFLALLVRLFFFIPGELELPFIALLLVIVAPPQAINLRGKYEGIVLSLVIAGYLAFQHFSRAGSLKRAFDQGSIIATLSIICIFAVSCFFMF